VGRKQEVGQDRVLTMPPRKESRMGQSGSLSTERSIFHDSKLKVEDLDFNMVMKFASIQVDEELDELTIDLDLGELDGMEDDEDGDEQMPILLEQRKSVRVDGGEDMERSMGRFMTENSASRCDGYSEERLPKRDLQERRHRQDGENKMQ
jgi:hypothetical protein